MSLPPEILKQVKLIELRTRRLVNNLFAGEYHTAFKGRGMTFAEFREYVPGDDVRTISWTVTARTGKPHIKKFNEERELTLLLAVDVSGSGEFGSQQYFKGEVMAYLAALIGFSATTNNDQVGLLLFSDQVEHFVPPKKGRAHVNRMVRDILYFQPKSRRTDLSVALSYLQGALKKKACVFLFSDFLDTGFDRALRQLGRKHDVISVVVQDPSELEIPNLGLVDFHDSETDEVMTVDTSSGAFRNAYRARMLEMKKGRDEELRRAQVDRIDIVNGKDFVDPLVAFFRGRRK